MLGMWNIHGISSALHKKLPAIGWIISLNESDKLKVIQTVVHDVKRGCGRRVRVCLGGGVLIKMNPN